MNFARLNHILVPATREERDRLRHGLVGRLSRPVGWLYGALSDEGRVLAVLTLFVGTAGMEVERTEVYILWSALVGLLLGSLLVRPLFRLNGVRLVVTTPPRVAVGEPFTLSVTLHNRDARPYCSIRVRRPFLPWDGRWLDPEPGVAVLEAGGTVRCDLRMRFVARGEHHLDVFRAGALVPFGIAVGPTLVSRGPRFVVVPRIANVVRIGLPSSHRYQPGGVAQASRVGEALELLGVRPYRKGDPVRDLHPRTWARTGKPHVREYQQEYFSRIGVILDNDRAEHTEAGFEAAISLCAGVVARLSRGEALIDLLVVGRELHPLTIGRSLGFFEQALDHLACAKLDEPLAEEELVARLDPYLARLSSIVLVSQSSHASRARLCDAIERRGVAVRVLRVHDDSPTFGKRPRVEADSGREVVVDLSHITTGAPLAL